MLCYFQGYHDVAQVLLLVFEPSCSSPSSACVRALTRLSLLRIRDFMLPSMAGSMPHLHLIPHILRAADPELASHVAGIAPFFALGATLTLYAHEISEYADVVRLFDFLLAREAVLSVYLFAAVSLLFFFPPTLSPGFGVARSTETSADTKTWASCKPRACVARDERIHRPCNT